MANGLATYIGYEAVQPADFTKMQEQFQKDQLQKQKQQEKANIAKMKSYTTAAESIRDFSNKRNPDLSAMIGQTVSDVRNALFFENTNNTGKTPAQVQMFNNNAKNGFDAYKQYLETYEAALVEFDRRKNEINPRTKQPYAGPLEDLYFAPLYYSQTDFSKQRSILDPTGRMYIDNINEKGESTGNYQPIEVNSLLNQKNFQSDWTDVSSYTKNFSKNIETLKTFRKSADGATTTTFSGMAIAFDSLGGADGKKFEEIYGGIIKDTYKAITAQPNVAANALLTSGTADYFVYEEGATTGRFALGNRDPELGIKMVVNGTNQRQAELTDKQLEELTHRIQDNVDGQLGFSKGSSYSSGGFAYGNRKEKARGNLITALELRRGNQPTWDRILNTYNNSPGLKADDKIYEYRVGPQSVELMMANGTTQEINIGQFKGDDLDATKSDLAELYRLIDRKAFDTSPKQQLGVEEGIKALPPTFDLTPYGFEGTRGKLISSTERKKRGLGSKLLFKFGALPGGGVDYNTTTLFDGVGNLVDEINALNYDPVKKATGRTSAIGKGGANIITSMKIYDKDATGAIANKIDYNAGQSLNKANFLNQTGLNATAKQNMMQNMGTNVQAASTGQQFIEMTVKGGKDGTKTKKFVFQAMPEALPDDQTFYNKNLTTYEAMLNFIKEPTRPYTDYYRGSTSDQYKRDLFK